jgi:hypothetical protein
LSSLRLIVPCTKRKRLPGDGLAVGQFKRHGIRDIDDLAERWRRQAICAAGGASLMAGTLYKGAQWPIIESARKQCSAHLHIISAGLGLLGENDRVPSYEATFSGGAPDSINVPDMTLAKAHQAWWKMLSVFHLPDQSGPRTLAGLMATHPDDCYLIVASPPYIQAIAADLLEGAAYDVLERMRRNHVAGRGICLTATELHALSVSQVGALWAHEEPGEMTVYKLTPTQEQALALLKQVGGALDYQLDIFGFAESPAASREQRIQMQTAKTLLRLGLVVAERTKEVRGKQVADRIALAPPATQ